MFAVTMSIKNESHSTNKGNHVGMSDLYSTD